MNKTELIAAITEKTGFTKKDAEKALNSVVDVITESLTKGEKVQIVGFGSFEVKDRPASENTLTLKCLWTKIILLGLLMHFNLIGGNDNEIYKHR